MKFLKIIGEFLAKYYDKIIMAILLVCLVIVLFIQIKGLDETEKHVKDADSDLRLKLPDNKIEQLDLGALSVSLDTDESRVWQKPFGEGNLFEPGRYVYSMDGSPYLLHVETRKSSFTGKFDLPEEDLRRQGLGSGADGQNPNNRSRDTDSDGLPDIFEEKNALDKVDPRDGRQDMDNDGFSNVEEFNAKSDINDPALHPPLVNRLRRLKLVRKPVEIKLKKVNMNNTPDDKKSWDIFVKFKEGKKWKTEFLKIGDEIPSTGYTVIDAEYKEIVEQKVPVEVSEITIRKGEKEAVKLVQDKDAHTGELYIELVFLYGKPKKFTVLLGSEFVLKDSVGNKEKYIVKQVGGNLIKAKSVESGQEFDLGELSDKDKNTF